LRITRKDGQVMNLKPLFSIVAILLFSAAAGAGCSGKSSEAGKQKAATASNAPVPVVTDTVKAQPVQRTVDFVGTLEPYEESTVASNLEAPVAKVYVDLGDRVKKGALLVKLDDEEFRIKVNLAEAALKEAQAKLGVEDEKDVVVDNVSYVKKARADYDDAETNLNRMRELQRKGYVAKAQLDEAQARRDMTKATLDGELDSGRSYYSTVKSRRASLELAKKQLRDTEVRASIDGFVSKKSVDPGDFTKVGGELVRIVRVDPIRLRGGVPEVNAPDIRLGREVTIRLSATPGREYIGKISRISPSSDPESRAFTVEALIPNSGAVLKPGYFAEASIKTRVDASALTVPLNSLVSYAGVNKVFVVRDGKAVEVTVTPGIRVGDKIEVAGALKEGDMVVMEGSKRLYSGKPVAVRKPL
jgi:RND family efflux transporter MFP subunit